MTPFHTKDADEVLVTWFCPRCIVGKLGNARLEMVNLTGLPSDHKELQHLSSTE